MKKTGLEQWLFAGLDGLGNIIWDDVSCRESNAWGLLCLMGSWWDMIDSVRDGTYPCLNIVGIFILSSLMLGLYDCS